MLVSSFFRFYNQKKRLEVEIEDRRAEKSLKKKYFDDDGSPIICFSRKSSGFSPVMVVWGTIRIGILSGKCGGSEYIYHTTGSYEHIVS